MLQILKHLDISKWYDLNRHSWGELEGKRNYSMVAVSQWK
jgi:hypothetical protein